MSSTLLCALVLLACASTVTDAQMSCEGRCGAEYYRGFGCQCDYTCLLYDECCKDYESLCTTKNSCKGRCGESFKRGRLCSCDTDCTKYKQCCPDYKLSCNTEETEISGPAGVTEPQKTNSCDNVNDNKPNKEATQTAAPDLQTVTPATTITPPSTVKDDPSNDMSTQRFPTLPDDSYSGSGLEVSGASPPPDSTSGSGLYLADPLENVSMYPTLPDILESSGLEFTTEMFPRAQAPTDKPTLAVDIHSSINPTTDSTDTSDPTSPPNPIQSLDPEETDNPDSNQTSSPAINPSTATATAYDPTDDGVSSGSTDGSASASGGFESSSVSLVTMLTTILIPTIIPSQDSSTGGYSWSGNVSELGVESSTGSGTWTTSGSSSTDVDQFTPEQTTADPLEVTQTPTPTPTPTKPKPSEPTSEAKDKPSLYKPSPTEPTPTKPIPKPKPKPLDTAETLNTDNSRDYQADDSNSTNLCSGRPISAVTTLRNGTMVAFRGHYFWMLDVNMVPSPARGITEFWGVPSPIDTVFTRCNCQGKTYMFKGGRYWRFDNAALDPGYPKVVATGFGGLRGQITAALSVPQYRRRKEAVYFFKQGGMVQKYSYQFGTSQTCGRNVHHVRHTVHTRLARQAVSLLEPTIKIRTSWRGFPSSITAAVSVPSSRVPEGYKYYVFSKSKFYKVQVDGEHPVVSAPPADSLPQRNSANDFFRCPARV